MADFTTNQMISSGNFLSRAANSFFDGLIYLGENSARGKLARKVSQTTDAELAAMGVTRADYVRRMFSGTFDY